MTRLASLIIAALASTAALADTSVIDCGALVDVENRRMIRDQQILVVDGVINEIGAGVDAPPHSPRIDLSDQYCLPGLMDTHVHLFIDSRVGTVVQAGVDNVREAVRRQVKYGADWIKITASGGVMSQHDDPRVQGWTDEEIFAFADEAHRLGVKITAHVHGDDAGLTPWDSIRAGTIVSAELLGLELEVGSLAVGKQGDIVAVSGNPVDDITVLEAVRFVMKGGKVIRNDVR